RDTFPSPPEVIGNIEVRERGRVSGRIPRYQPTGPLMVMPEQLFASADESIPMDNEDFGAAAIEWHQGGSLQFTEPLTRAQLRSLSPFGAQRVFRFVVEDSRGRVLDTEVMLVDFQTKRRLSGFMPGEHVAVNPGRRGQMIAFVCDVLGYAQEVRMFNLDRLSRGKDIRLDKDGVYEVKMQLRKMPLYDIALLDEVSFHSDAAILDPTSEAELNKLLMM